MLERTGNTHNFEVLPIAEMEGGMKGGRSPSLLILYKVTETGSPFIVVAGYYLNQVGAFEGSILAEIETVPESQYSELKQVIRGKLGQKLSKVPITFW
jgi:hypothetical protein